ASVPAAEGEGAGASGPGAGLPPGAGDADRSGHQRGRATKRRAPKSGQRRGKDGASGGSARGGGGCRQRGEEATLAVLYSSFPLQEGSLGIPYSADADGLRPGTGV